MDVRQEQVVPWLAFGLSMVLCLRAVGTACPHVTLSPFWTCSAQELHARAHARTHAPTHPRTHARTQAREHAIFSKPCHAKRAFYLGKTLKSQQKTPPLEDSRSSRPAAFSTRMRFPTRLTMCAERCLFRMPQNTRPLASAATNNKLLQTFCCTVLCCIRYFELSIDHSGSYSIRVYHIC